MLVGISIRSGVGTGSYWCSQGHYCRRCARKLKKVVWWSNHFVGKHWRPPDSRECSWISHFGCFGVRSPRCQVVFFCCDQQYWWSHFLLWIVFIGMHPFAIKNYLLHHRFLPLLSFPFLRMTNNSTFGRNMPYGYLLWVGYGRSMHPMAFWRGTLGD